MPKNAQIAIFFNLTYMQSTSCEMPNWMTQFGIKIAGRNINNLTHADDTIIMAEMEEEIKSLLMRVKEKSEKADLKFNIQKTNIMASRSITSWQIKVGKMEKVGSKITADGDCSHEIKRHPLL